MKTSITTTKKIYGTNTISQLLDEDATPPD